MNIILKYFPGISDQQHEQLAQLKNLYETWNSKINVISRKDIEHLFEHHVLHSLAVGKIISFKNKTSILDVGSGGGLPGIPLAILFPECNFHLVDSIGKKVKVMEAITSGLHLANVNCEKARAEELKGRWDFITGRAVTSLPVFSGWVKKLINPSGFNDIPNGILYLKGGSFQHELTETRMKYKTYPLSEIFDEIYFKDKSLVYLYA